MQVRLFSLWVLLSLAWPLWAQKADTLPESRPDSTRFTRYQVMSLGASWPLLRDQAISPLRYSGWGGMVGAQLWWEKPSIIKQVVLKGGGALMSNEANGNQLTLLHAELHYHYYRKVESCYDDRLRLFAGGGADAWMYFKFLSLNVNNGIGYDIGGSLKASGLLQYDFTFLKKKFTLTEQLSVPFVAVVARPPFSWPDPYDAYEPGGSWTSAIRVHSFGNYLGLYADQSSERKQDGRSGAFAGKGGQILNTPEKKLGLAAFPIREVTLTYEENILSPSHQ
jgi:hypothetical protein